MHKLPRQPLIFTDLDGTLLDHDDYSIDAVKPWLQKLNKAGISVIPTTSKTTAELHHLMPKLGLMTPFIVENGAAVYLPKALFQQAPAQTQPDGDYWVKSFTLPRAHWLFYIEQAKAEFGPIFIPMGEMSLEQLIALTGLSFDEAQQAQQRQYGEPIQWLGSEVQQQAFIEFIQNHGASVLKGGRFLHVGGGAQKATAMQWLIMMYQQIQPHKDWYSIALGDSDNDISMLESADYAVRIRSKHHPLPDLKRQERVLSSHQYGPSGWVECIQQLLAGHVT